MVYLLFMQVQSDSDNTFSEVLIIIDINSSWDETI